MEAAVEGMEKVEVEVSAAAEVIVGEKAKVARWGALPIFAGAAAVSAEVAT